MTNLIHTCFILRYVYHNPLHVSSIICSSSGGWIVLMQHLVSSGAPWYVLCFFSWLSVVRVWMECIEMHGQKNTKYLTLFARSQDMQHRAVASSYLRHNESLRVWSKAPVACWWVLLHVWMRDNCGRRQSVEGPRADVRKPTLPWQDVMEIPTDWLHSLTS